MRLSRDVLFSLAGGIALLWVGSVCAQSAPLIAPHTYEVPGGFLPGREPDGNTYVLKGKGGLTLIDTGRHAAHRAKIEALAGELHAPVVAIVNTHWHLDHVSGNPELRSKYP